MKKLETESQVVVQYRHKCDCKVMCNRNTIHCFIFSTTLPAFRAEPFTLKVAQNLQAAIED